VWCTGQEKQIQLTAIFTCLRFARVTAAGGAGAGKGPYPESLIRQSEQRNRGANEGHRTYPGAGREEGDTHTLFLEGET
jgi:hypothetical protein